MSVVLDGARRSFDGVRGRADAVTLLTVYLVLLFGIPSQFVVGPLGGAATPFQVLGMGCLLWWVWVRINAGAPVLAPTRPIRVAAALFAASVLVAYVMACFRPISAQELSTATTGLINLTAWLGVLLLGHDGISTRERWTRLLGRLSTAGCLMALFGLFQFLTHRRWINELSIPGLTTQVTLFEAQDREGFTRPSGTAVHPIEFGSLLAMLLPLAIAWSIQNRSAHPLRRWIPPAAILLAVTLSSSRSALVCAGVGLVLFVITLPPAFRRWAAAGLAALGVAVFVLVPGMLGTILGLFTQIGTDSSAASRVDSYGPALSYVQRAPLFGRGLGTFLPRYRIFDNEYLLLLVEIGVVGLVCVLGLLGTAMWVGRRSSRAAPDFGSSSLARALVAGIAAGALSLALFDAFSFAMNPGLLFLLVGLVGSADRLTTDSPNPRVVRALSSSDPLAQSSKPTVW